MEFSFLYHQHKKMVFNLALHYVWCKEDAEEVTQDVFLKVSEGYHQFRQDSSIKTWIYRITVNTSLDYIKSKMRKRRGGGWRPLFIDGPDWNDRTLIPFAHPGFHWEQQEQVESIMRWIFQLPPQQRDVIILTKLEGYSHAEAATLMKISAKSVENFVFRAKRQLQEKLNAQKEKE